MKSLLWQQQEDTDWFEDKDILSRTWMGLL